MKTHKALKIAALSCVAVFAIGVMAFGLATGFGIRDLLGFWRDTEQNGSYDTPYTYTESLEYLDELAIDWAAGPVTLSLYDGDDVTVTETAQHALKEDEKLSLEIDGGKLTVRWNSAWLNLGVSGGDSKRLEVQVPRALAGDLSRISVYTASGTLQTADFAAREISLKTVSGGIEASNLSAGRLALNSTSGTIRGEGLEGTERLEAGNVSGKTALADVRAGTLKISSTSGTIEAEGAAASADCGSVSGAVSLTMQTWAEETAISTVSGGVTLRGPETEAGFTCRYSTVSGDMTCGFNVKQSGSEYIAGKGEAAVSITTTSGDAELGPIQ